MASTCLIKDITGSGTWIQERLLGLCSWRDGLPKTQLETQLVSQEGSPSPFPTPRPDPSGAIPSRLLGWAGKQKCQK